MYINTNIPQKLIPLSNGTFQQNKYVYNKSKLIFQINDLINEKKTICSR